VAGCGCAGELVHRAWGGRGPGGQGEGEIHDAVAAHRWQRVVPVAVGVGEVGGECGRAVQVAGVPVEVDDRLGQVCGHPDGCPPAVGGGVDDGAGFDEHQPTTS